ncbi:MAG TPA: tRNA epoxyqueuosine(34) reductase QueG [Opitutaceae bacterium]
MITADRQLALRQRLEALGFDDVRFAALAAPVAPPLREWLAAGMHADMQWMERSVDKRLNPALVLPGARSIIMLGVSYWHAELAGGQGTKDPGPVTEDPELRSPISDVREPSAAHAPRWARYALHEDYHDTIKPGLVAAGKALEELFGATATDYRYYVDTGPVLERSWAARAGLGFTGKNAMLISRRHGNWLFLSGILTTLEFAPDEPIRKKLPDPSPQTAPQPVGLLCGKCTRCLDACPTDAFAAPGVVDARRCVSYQTIENKGIIPRELRSGIGARIYGCDTCLEVCPWNRFAQQGRQFLLAARHDLADLPLGEILALTPERFAEVFRRTPIKRLKLVGLLRNACIVAANLRETSVLPQLIALASGHASPIVRAHAVWAARELGAGEQLAAARAAEQDAVVLAEFA